MNCRTESESSDDGRSDFVQLIETENDAASGCNVTSVLVSLCDLCDRQYCNHSASSCCLLLLWLFIL